MFQPTQAEVRRFFCTVHAKAQSGQAMEAIEVLASEWIALHPEYHADLADADAAVARAYPDNAARTNPFLHLSMHLSLARRRNSLHDAHHEVMDALGEMLWQAQRSGRPPDGAAYVDAVQRRATKD